MKVKILDAQGGVLEELETHASFAASLDIDLSAVSPYEETLAYTGFLLEIANSRPLGETIAAMTPCMRLYAWLGQQLASGGIPSHAYTDWIVTYSSEEFEALAASLEASLDRFVADENAAAAAYQRAMECELAFFSAPLREQ